MADIITVGRDPKSTIRVSDQYDTVSNEHADIRQDGVEIVFTDHSSNGTLINGQKIQRRSVNIYRGDKIVLAGTFLLDWPQIEHYLKPVGRPTVTRNIHGDTPYRPGRPTDMMAGGAEQRQPGRPTDMMAAHLRDRQGPSGMTEWAQKPRQNEQPTAARASRIESPEIDRWNWGAFYFGWVWGVFNKVYVSLVQLVLQIIAFGLPFLGMEIVAPIFSAAGLGVAIWMGVKGSRMAWDNGAYSGTQDFIKTRNNWNLAALVCLIVSLLFMLIALLLFMDLLTRVL